MSNIPSTSQSPNLNSEITPLIHNNNNSNNNNNYTNPLLRVNPRKRTLWPWVILVTLVVIANCVVLFLLFEGFGIDTRQHFVDSYDPKSILKHIHNLEKISENNGGSIALGKGYNASIDYIYDNIGKDSPCILYKQHFRVPNWELNKVPTFKKTRFQKVDFKLNEEFVVLPFGGKSTRIGSTRVLSVDSKGCSADHYFGLKGRVAIIPHDPKCSLFDFAKSAQDMGALAVAFYTPKNQIDLLSNYTLLPSNWESEEIEFIHIPVLSINYGVAISLLEDELNSQVSIALDSTQEITTSTNLICHVKGKVLDLDYGNPSSVIIIGGHLDSYKAREMGEDGSIVNSKQINNISGASVLLEIVNTIKRSQFKPFNHLYFTWFGSRKFQTLGSKHFIQTLEKDEPLIFNRTLMFINLENLDNNLPQVYDGNTLQLPNLRNASHFLTNLMEEHFKEDNLKYELTPINEKSGKDSLNFLKMGIPVGGITSGNVNNTQQINIKTEDRKEWLDSKTLTNCAESLITTIGALATNEKLLEYFKIYY